MLIKKEISNIATAIKYIFAGKEKREYMKLPYSCQHCEVLGICRDKASGWKCRKWCLVLKK